MKCVKIKNLWKLGNIFLFAKYRLNFNFNFETLTLEYEKP